jgi:DNA-nicking Smr family endonuclease
MSYINLNAWKAVNDAIVNTGAKGVRQIVSTANSSVKKRRQNKEERKKRKAKEKAAKNKADAAVYKLKPPEPAICWRLSITEKQRLRLDIGYLRAYVQPFRAGLVCSL